MLISASEGSSSNESRTTINEERFLAYSYFLTAFRATNMFSFKKRRELNKITTSAAKTFPSFCFSSIVKHFFMLFIKSAPLFIVPVVFFILNRRTYFITYCLYSSQLGNRNSIISKTPRTFNRFFLKIRRYLHFHPAHTNNK